MNSSICNRSKIFRAVLFCLALGGIATLFAQDEQPKLSVGGHVAITLFDAAAGFSTTSRNHNDTTSDYAGLKFLKFIPFFKYDFTEKLSVDIRPIMEVNGIDGTTGATPAFGKAIGDQRAKSARLEFGRYGFTRAAARAILPGATELGIGFINTRFTWDYGNELFWEDEMNGSKFSCNPLLGDLSGMGIEMLRYFEVGDATLPVYAALLTSESLQETNNTPIAMVNVEPSLGRAKLHVAVAGGLWDSEDTKGFVRGAAGFSFNKGPVGIRTEGSLGYFKDQIGNSEESALPHGAYCKLFLKPAKSVRFVLNANYAYYNFVNQYAPLPGSEKYLTITPSMQILTNEHSRLELQVDVCKWTQKPWDQVDDFDKELTYFRPSLGWRMTF